MALTRERSADPPEPMAVMHLTRAKAHSTPIVDAAPQADFAAQRTTTSASHVLEHNQEDAATRSDMAQRFVCCELGPFWSQLFRVLCLVQLTLDLSRRTALLSLLGDR